MSRMALVSMTTTGYEVLVVTPALRAALAAVVLAGCGAHPMSAEGPPSPQADHGTAPRTSAASSSQSTGEPTISDDAALPPDQDGNPVCAAYDTWRSGPAGAAITVTHWFDGTGPVTVTVRLGSGPDLSQTVDDDDLTQRHHDFEFIDVDPTTVTEVLVATGDTRCVVRAAPS